MNRKKQLTSRFAIWQFKKNVKGKETESFLQASLSVQDKGQIQVRGVRIDAAKRERWQKRLKKRAITKLSERHRSIPASPQPSTEPRNSTETSQITQHEELSHNSSSPSKADNISTHPPSSLLAECIVLGPHNKRSDTVASQSPSTLSENTIPETASSLTSSSDIEGPVAADKRHEDNDESPPQQVKECIEKVSSAPRGDQDPLLRLFSALDLARPNDIEPFCQPSLEMETNLQDRDTIANEEFWDLKSNGENKDLGPTDMFLKSPLRETSKKRTAMSAFKEPDADVIFPSKMRVSATSLDGELYPFPRHQNLEVAIKPKYHDILQMELSEGKKKTEKLERCSPRINPGVTASIYDLAVAYSSLGHYENAEKHLLRILPILIQRHGYNSHSVVWVKGHLTEAMMQLGRYTAANQLAQDVHTAALNIDQSGGCLAQMSLLVLAHSYGYLGDLEKKKELLRSLVQVRLVAYGPKHGETLLALRHLSYPMEESKMYAEGEELLRVALELSQSVHRVSDLEKCRIPRALATFLYRQQGYGESEILHCKALGMSEKLLGDEHQDTLRCKFWVSGHLRARGRLEHSRELLRETVGKQIETLGELRGPTIQSMTYLSLLLLQMNQIEEAGTWMKRAVHCSQRSGRIDSIRAAKFYDGINKLHEGPKSDKEPEQTFEDMIHDVCSSLYSFVGGSQVS